MTKRKLKEQARATWIDWLKTYGAGRFYDSFVENAQDARGKCIICDEEIYLDIVEGGGVPDWRTEDGDYGCGISPDTSWDGTGSHVPVKF